VKTYTPLKVLMTIAGIVIGIFIWNKISTKGVTTPDTKPLNIKPLSRIERSAQIKKALLRSSRENLPAANFIENKSPECASFEKELKTWQVKDILENRFELRDQSPCFTEEQKSLKRISKYFYDACKDPFPKDADPKSKEFSECLNSFVTLRAILVSKEYQDLPSNSLTDPKILIDRLIASFAEMNVKEMSESAERLVELEPDLYEAHKARITARFIQSHMGGDEKPDWARLDEYLKELADFKVTDQEFLDLEAMVKSRAMGDKEALDELIRSLGESPETQAFSKYLEAGSLNLKGAPWTNSNLDRAIRLVREAINAKPDEIRFKNSLEALEKIKIELKAGKTPKTRAFSFNFGFHFDLD